MLFDAGTYDDGEKEIVRRPRRTRGGRDMATHGNIGRERRPCTVRGIGSLRANIGDDRPVKALKRRVRRIVRRRNVETRALPPTPCRLPRKFGADDWRR